MTEEDRLEQPALPVFRPMWNAVVTYRQENTTREVDRRSWITIDSQPVRYKLDPTGLPQYVTVKIFILKTVILIF